ncbi:hybrid sensor histidine kinase/response regulator [Ramlibacter rhizophilus]|uniref:histidine kinase n=1 Tax=Ramlibacter rhizophilus TaxID=1781167 RepID=A0A4Z0BCE2_9BURK|nr:ATP-binding protein [Ramlibacter rhizophilus]TFY96915.1 hybrid sensor histidine kinase/response regulator [Ramlibacter rhizophilus]
MSTDLIPSHCRLGLAVQALALSPQALQEPQAMEAALSRALQACLPALGDLAWVDLPSGSHWRRILVSGEPLGSAAWPADSHRTDRDPSLWASEAQRIVRLDGNALAHVQALACGGSTHLQRLAALGVHSLLSIPLCVGEESGGALSIALTTPGARIDEARWALARQLAQLLAAPLGQQRLAALQASARDAAQARDEFLAVLGHELRNPLAPISTALELMARREPERLLQERRVIGRQVAHLSRLVDDLLDVSRLARGKIQLRPECIDLRSIVARALEQTAAAFEGREPVQLVQPECPVWVSADAPRLTQVVSQLLLNAAKFTPPGGSVNLQLQRAGDHACLEVVDTGCGIAASLLPRVFDLFVQGGQALDRRQGGLGLGLSLVRSLVELHGGTVSAHSPGPSQGCRVHVQLPTCPAPTLAIAPQAAPAASGQGLRILVVDDNVDAGGTLAELLGLLGHRVELAADASEALALLPAFRPELAILDLGLPQIDGFELARRIRLQAQWRQLPLIALTGYGTQADRIRALQAGFDEHVAKPVLIEPLCQIIDRLVAASAPRTLREPPAMFLAA